MSDTSEKLAAELVSFAGLLNREIWSRRYLTVPFGRPGVPGAIDRQLLSGKAAVPITLDVLEDGRFESVVGHP